PEIRAEAALVLKHLGPAARPAVPQLLRCLDADENNLDIRRTASALLVALVRRDEPTAVHVLSAALADRDAEVRLNAALALGNIGGTQAIQAVPELRRALKSGSTAVR